MEQPRTRLKLFRCCSDGKQRVIERSIHSGVRRETDSRCKVIFKSQRSTVVDTRNTVSYLVL